ncbi:hypothetical protein SAMN05443507_10382 [Alicyclobacillus tolerans]|uniref:Uncharacterized protein n=1 Tax=Alicyclobacillus tolerans TaxID=90970 RepID=A0A1M6LU69_9BACL|nr:hypothetical protein SAMN05443507_10382 [Alicyclobacillus montanus]
MPLTQSCLWALALSLTLVFDHLERGEKFLSFHLAPWFLLLYLRKTNFFPSKISSSLSKISCSLQHGWIRVKSLDSPVLFVERERQAGETQSKILKETRREKARYIKDSKTMPDQKREKIHDKICTPCALKPFFSPSRQRTTSFYAKSMNLEKLRRKTGEERRDPA